MRRCAVSRASEPLFSSTQGPLFLTISHINRRPNRNPGPRHGLGGRRDAASLPPASSSCRFHQGNKRSGIRDTMLPIQVSGRPGPTAAAAAGRFMTCSKCHLFNSPRWLRHLWTQRRWTAGQAGPGDVPPLTATHEHSRERAWLSQEGGRGCPAPLPAVCDELIHQLSHQGVHVLGGALRLQGQVDLLQAGFLGKGGQESRRSLRGEGAPWTPAPSPVATPSP